MNQSLLWTTTALLTTALATPSVAYARSRDVNQAQPIKAVQASTSLPAAQSVNVSKGENDSPNRAVVSSTGIARVQPHELQGQMAATLYVRNVPVLTFVGSSAAATNSTSEFQQLNEPIWRASSVARKINQLRLDNNEDASAIVAVWEPSSESQTTVKHVKRTHSNSERYLIKVKGATLVEINASTRLPDTISDPAKDALQATNRLRKLIGNAPPLHKISGKFVPLPRDKFIEQIALGLVRMRLTGLASWYGPGFDGNRSANGEIYNQNELTAAHRDLPFGTRVLVTNTQNGYSVVVRITDRGPFIAGRILDLSTAAAGIIGMIQPGVVPVTVDVLAQELPSASGVVVGKR